jgi:hypothetical protein
MQAASSGNHGSRLNGYGIAPQRRVRTDITSAQRPVARAIRCGQPASGLAPMRSREEGSSRLLCRASAVTSLDR